MNIFPLVALSVLTLLSMGACGTGNDHRTTDRDKPSPVSKDWHTYSNADSVRVKHLSLNIAVDFDKKEIKGSARWEFKFLKNSESIVFDTHELSIDSVVMDDDSHPAYSLGTPDDVMGAPLRIPVGKNNKALTIYYHTGTQPIALQWLSPAQTFGKQSPFLYTQSESIYARSWIPCQDGPGIRYTYDARVKVPRDCWH